MPYRFSLNEEDRCGSVTHDRTWKVAGDWVKLRMLGHIGFCTIVFYLFLMNFQNSLQTVLRPGVD